MQKKYINLLVMVICSLALASCKKELTFKPSGASSLTIVDGVVGNGFMYTNFNGVNKPKGVSYWFMSVVNYGSSAYFDYYSGQQKLGLFQDFDTTATSKPLYNLTLNLPVNTIHTLFLMGTPQAPDQLFTTDLLPYHPVSDSTMGIRFVNIAQGSDPVSVNLAGQANGSEADGLAYKGITPFKNYSARSAISSYTFEFRDKATGALLGSCVIDGVNNDGSQNSPNLVRNRNFTIAFLGASGGQAPDRGLLISEDQSASY
ncbi:hypothetical protein [Mucilaginibacter sp.]|uniref:hypothetical protein n=1 Tax=Mucilaginibacter sp. TaxID=1882438 RepID=UPI00284AB148|nr:hypothetical protein [Mucilaginibacter sp.]MDR3694216.1 hypothetical protein [Mucilaginibacter sp.]